MTALPKYGDDVIVSKTHDVSDYIKAEPLAMDLLTRLLILDPNKRITAIDALRHDYFTLIYISPCDIISYKPNLNLNIKIDYMSRQLHINTKMRSILIDWMILVCIKLKLSHMTFFLSCAYLDLFLTKRMTSLTNLQLVGCTTMFIAGKIIEIYPPNISDYVCISEKAYTVEKIKAMEAIMVNALNHDLYVRTEYNYLCETVDLVKRKDTLKKLYLSILNLDNRRFDWTVLLDANIGDIPEEWKKGYVKMCTKIDIE